LSWICLPTILFQKAKCEKFGNWQLFFWFSELEDARNTRCLCRKKSKSKVHVVASVKAIKSPKKATEWSGIKKDNLPMET
jgi:hypothetical protein